MCKSTRLILSGTDSSYVYSAQLPRSQRGIGTERLVAEKMDIGAELAERWLPEMMSVVFTSATMAVRDDFSHFEHAVGLDQLDASDRRCVQLDSSFDYDEQMGVVVCRDLPDPGSSGYLAALEDLLLDVHVAMGGSVLTLFTNRREMERVYEGLEPRLAEHGLDLIMQERGGANRLLRERFLSEETLSMFALKAFWEGFDAGGDTLRCVVIPKLPFASPRDPLVQERSSRESGAWFRYSLPEAVLTVKQASGRLIRTATDQGVLVLCDSRLVRKRYGNDFISSLQSRNCSVLPSSDVASYIEEWRSRHERL
jgi:ATP-dependent DNA helicase DinG